jgi:hypothetical protein
MKGCEEKRKSKLPLCQKHWADLPYMARRNILKTLIFNDFIETEDSEFLLEFGVLYVIQEERMRDEKKFSRWVRRKLI